MTSDAARKKAARDLASREGLSYTAALRRLNADATSACTVAAANPVDLGCWRLKYATSDDGYLRPDTVIQPGGFIAVSPMTVYGEDFFLVGFAEDTEARTTPVTRQQFLEDPAAAVGLHPVVLSCDGTMGTITAPVAQVTSHTRNAPTHPVRATWIPEGHDSPPPFDFYVEQWLENLPRATLDRLAAAGWKVEELTRPEERDWLMFYHWALWRGDTNAAAVERWVEANTVEDLDGIWYPFRIEIAATEADAWLTASRRR